MWFRSRAAILQETPEKLDIQNGWIVDAATLHPRIELSEIARIVYFRSDTLPPGTQAQLSVAHHYAPQGYPFAFTNGVQGCHLELDAETGLVKILKIGWWRTAAASSIRCWSTSRSAEASFKGSAPPSSRNASTARMASSPMARSPIISFRWPSRCPTSRSAHVETPTLDTQLGAKGVGEAGTAAASAAALNAVNDAMAPSAASIAQLPMTPARILKALGHI